MKTLQESTQIDTLRIITSIAITVIAFIMILIHLIRPNLAINTITISLFVIAIIPWLLPYVKYVKIFGVEFVTENTPESIEMQENIAAKITKEQEQNINDSGSIKKELNKENISEPSINSKKVLQDSSVKEISEETLKQHPLFKSLVNDLDFERICNVIYGSQIIILKYLLSFKATGGVPEVRLYVYYNSILFNKSPELLPSIFNQKNSLDQLNMMNSIVNNNILFLFKTNFIVKDTNNKILITKYGSDFLEYINKTYPFIYKEPLSFRYR